MAGLIVSINSRKETHRALLAPQLLQYLYIHIHKAPAPYAKITSGPSAQTVFFLSSSSSSIHRGAAFFPGRGADHLRVGRSAR